MVLPCFTLTKHLLKLLTPMRLGGNQNLENSWEEIAGYENAGRDFPDGPVVGILCFHCRGLGFHSWLGNWNLTSCAA